MSDSVRTLADVPKEEIFETVELYRTFSYSKEYDASADAYTTGRELLAALSTRKSDGQIDEKFVYEAETVFAENGLAHRYDDPRRALLISALVLYFSGIVVRRSKFLINLRRKAAQSS